MYNLVSRCCIPWASLILSTDIHWVTSWKTQRHNHTYTCSFRKARKMGQLLNQRNAADLDLTWQSNHNVNTFDLSLWTSLEKRETVVQTVVQMVEIQYLRLNTFCGFSQHSFIFSFHLGCNFQCTDWERESSSFAVRASGCAIICLFTNDFILVSHWLARLFFAAGGEPTLFHGQTAGDRVMRVVLRN